ncbi:hypothetical protein [Roseovarius sp. D0-M9]|uniref:hypothetical protein n=1 Tax=Roseovarius sp. D0-M9 TaxID=3127117 RepID=UPI0030102E5C
MKISIYHRVGKIRRLSAKLYPKVIVSIDFNAEEMNVLVRENLGRYTLVKCVPFYARADRDPSIHHMRIKDLMKGRFEYLAENELEAQSFEAELREELKYLQSLLEHGG